MPFENNRSRVIGRPPEMTGGKRTNIYLDDDSRAIAEKLGNGNVSEGIRIALKKALTVSLNSI